MKADKQTKKKQGRKRRRPFDLDEHLASIMALGASRARQQRDVVACGLVRPTHAGFC
jgi:hypothetical protein